jgi:GNAT superfamily N-acetyltransferase
MPGFFAVIKEHAHMNDRSLFQSIGREPESVPEGLVKEYISELSLACADIVEGGDRVEELRNSLASGALKGYVLLRGGEPAAFLLFREVERLLFVHHFYVARQFRDGRSGTQLMACVKDYFSNAGHLTLLTCAFFPAVVDFGADEARALGFRPYERFAMERALHRETGETGLPAGFTISPLEDRHLPRLALVLHETNKGNVDNEIRPGIFDTPPLCLAFLSQIQSGAFGMFNYATSLLAFEENEIVGAIFGTYRLSGSGFVAANFVHPAYQGRGLGKALLSVLLDKFREFGTSKVSLCVSADNERARRLYEHNGFAITSRYFEALYPPTSPP